MLTPIFETNSKWFTIKNASYELMDAAKAQGLKYSYPNHTVDGVPLYWRPFFQKMAGVEIEPLPVKDTITVFVHEYPEVNEKRQLTHHGDFEITVKLEKELWTAIKANAKYYSAYEISEAREDGLMLADFSGWHYGLESIKNLVKQGYEVKLIDDRTRVEVILPQDFTRAVGGCNNLKAKVAEYKAAKAKAKEEAEAKKAELEAIKVTVIANGEMVVTETEPEGPILADTTNIHGVGSKFVITETHIWYLDLHGMDGDNFSLNNVAGRYRGWCVPYTAELDERLRSLAKK